MATKQISIKLLVDTKQKKVLFAEASKDFVDYLFNLLALPVGTVIKLLTTEFMVGSIANLYTSMANLNETYLQPNVDKDVLLNPMTSTSVTNIPLLITGGSTTSKKFYSCENSYCPKAISDKYDVVKCPSCLTLMNSEVIIVDASTAPIFKQRKNMKAFPNTLLRKSINQAATPPFTSNDNKDSDGYVKELISYMISDDLLVTPMSMISSISIINKFNVSKLDVLEEREVKVGSLEGLELLKTSFQTNTVLTHVFLGKKKGKRSI